MAGKGHFVRIPRWLAGAIIQCNFTREELIFLTLLATNGGGAREHGCDRNSRDLEDFSFVFGADVTEQVIARLAKDDVIESTNYGLRIVDATSCDERPLPKRKPIGNSTRFKVLHRDGFKCRYCGKDAAQAQLEVDHVTPVSKGGTNDEDNLVAACFDCNRGKAGRRMTAEGASHG